MQAVEEIIGWAQDLPEWQADAVRRFLEQGDLTGQDKEELYQLLKAEFEIEPTSIVPIPPQIGTIAGSSSIGTPISLQRISDINNVSAIEQGASIPFGHTGVTVIYGENGSGKSSYARILKKACRARDTKDSILPNVFTEQDRSPASATIRVSQDSINDIDLHWVDGESSDRRLSSVTFFDSRCARVIVDENNDATYIPYGCEVFDALGNLITNFKARLEHEKPSPMLPKHDSIIDNTDSAIFLKNINRNTKPTELSHACEWDDGSDSQLESLTARLASSGSNNLLKESQRIETVAERARFLLDGIKAAQTTLSDKTILRVNEVLTEVRTQNNSVLVAANKDLQHERLRTGDSDEWKELYGAAKRYSEKVAYPGADFPSTETNDLCVLCHQELDEPAKDRLLRFKDFMGNKSEQARQHAVEALNSALTSVSICKVPQSIDYGNVLDELDVADRKLVEDKIKNLQAIKDAISNTTAETASIEMNVMSMEVLPVLESLNIKLLAAAKKAKEDADPAAHLKLEKESRQLASRKIMSTIKSELKIFIDQKKVEYDYERAIRSLSTRPISSKSKDIISKALSPQLQGDLSKELQNLNADHLPLAITITGKEGGARHQLSIKETKQVKPSVVFSEGELCVVAIAGFMAELSGSPVNSPIVFDDPVSSLDHQYSRKIADRLVSEASQRQVIIFTHNIAFLVEIEKRCAGIPLLVRTVKRHGKVPGRCIEGLPWEASSVKDRLAEIDRRINEITDLFEVEPEKYNEKAAYIYDLLRETWEASVEQNLLNGIVRRHDTDIGTQRLNKVEVQDEDCKRVNEGMSKCSEWMAGHDKSQVLSVNRPSPTELRDDVQSLRTFMKELNTRHGKVEARRKKVLKPLVPTYG